jgi:hypothetical protein
LVAAGALGRQVTQTPLRKFSLLAGIQIIPTSDCLDTLSAL